MNTIEENIRNFLNGTLPEIEMKKIEGRIDEDPSYREMFEKIIRLNDDLGELVFPKAPDGLAEKIVDQYKTEMTGLVVYQESQAERRLDKVFTAYLLAAPVIVFLLYLGIALTGKQVSLAGLENGLKGSWIVWTLILFNIIFIVLLIRTRSVLKHSFL